MFVNMAGFIAHPWNIGQVMELLAGEDGSIIQIRVRRGNVSYDVCLQRGFCRPEPPTRKPAPAEKLLEQPRGNSNGSTCPWHNGYLPFNGVGTSPTAVIMHVPKKGSYVFRTPGAAERIYAGMAKLNQALERTPEQRLTEEELRQFRAMKDEEARQMQAQAQREFDSLRRRNAEIQVLKY